MSSLKSLFFLAVLAAAACGLYISLNRPTESTIPSGVLKNGSDKPTTPKVEIPSTPMRNTSLGTAFASTSRTSPGPGLPAAPGGAAALGPIATAYVPSSPAAVGGAAPPIPAPPGAYGAGVPPARGPAASAQDAGSSGMLDALMKTVQSEMAQGQVAEAHLLLSSLYGDPRVPPEQAGQITRLLDQMAATVIYSRQHMLEPAYRVKPGDTLEQIAAQYNVPSQLLAKINGIRDPQNLPPGRELKVVRGPFNALVDLSKGELTLKVKDRYAGRFRLDVSANAALQPDTYTVKDKGDNRTANSPGGRYGKFWIAVVAPVGPVVGPHEAFVGPPAYGAPVVISDAPGTVPLALGERDMEDIFGILSVGSRVVIQR